MILIRSGTLQTYLAGVVAVLSLTAVVADEPRKQVLKAEGSGSLSAVAISADGKILAQTEDGIIRVWDLPAAKLLRSWKWKPSTLGAQRIALSPDGKRLATTSTALYHGDILVYDTANGELLWKQEDATESSWLELTFSPDGKRLVSTGNFIARKDEESLLKVWDAADGHFLRELKGGTKFRDLPIPFTPDGKTVVALSGADRLVFWDIETGKASPEVRVPNDDGAIAEYAAAPDGKTLAIRTTKSLYLWDRPSGKRLRVLSTKEGEGGKLQFSADGFSVLGFNQAGLQAWDVKTGEVRTLLKMEYSSPRAFSPDRKVLASGFDVHLVPK